jgi:hypothetical protein
MKRRQVPPSWPCLTQALATTPIQSLRKQSKPFGRHTTDLEGHPRRQVHRITIKCVQEARAGEADLGRHVGEALQGRSGRLEDRGLVAEPLLPLEHGLHPGDGEGGVEGGHRVHAAGGKEGVVVKAGQRN